MTTTTLSSTSLPSSVALPLTTTINQPTLQLSLRRRKRQLNSDLYCLKSLALCCPFPFNCLVCGGLALSACPGSRNAKLRVLLALTGRSKDYLWVAGKAAGWFGLFAGLAFTATYQLKVWQDEQMYGVRSGSSLSSLLTSPSPSTIASLTPSLQFSSWLIAGALILILSAFALGLWHFKKVKKRKGKISKLKSLKTTTRRVRRSHPTASANV